MQASIVFCTLFLVLEPNLGLEYNRRYNTNTDFLFHESGGNPSGQKKDTTQGLNSPNPLPSNGKNDYFSQFPSLGHQSPSPTNINSGAKPTAAAPSTTNSKRDYVPPHVTTPKPQVGQSTQPQSNSNVAKPGTAAPGSKRDYVAPQFPTTKPAQTNQQSTGKVKDLINFYDSQGKGQNSPQKVPSYSNILQGNKNLPSSITTPTTKITQPFSPTTAKPTSTKPFSFSSVVAGSHKPGSPHPGSQPTLATPKPTTRVPVLPSEILNNNRNTNQGSARGPTDSELQILSEELLRKDTNNAAKYITVNYQEKTTSGSIEDKAPLPLLNVSSQVWNIPTIEKFVPLLDNYERDTLVNEHVTPYERNEENAFMDAIMSTTVIRHLMNFLKDKGYVTPDPRQQRDFLKQLWFSLYSRGKGKIGSSGFEHIFVSELKNGQVSGLHNWIYFSKEESSNRANYLGYLKYKELGDKGAVLKHHFNQQGADKPVDTMFVGTSPELEMALYTLCFVTRADNDCKLKLSNAEVNIVTHTFRYRSKNLIGSAYPEI